MVLTDFWWLPSSPLYHIYSFDYYFRLCQRAPTHQSIRLAGRWCLYHRFPLNVVTFQTNRIKSLEMRNENRSNHISCVISQHINNLSSVVIDSDVCYYMWWSWWVWVCYAILCTFSDAFSVRRLFCRHTHFRTLLVCFNVCTHRINFLINFRIFFFTQYIHERCHNRWNPPIAQHLSFKLQGGQMYLYLSTASIIAWARLICFCWFHVFLLLENYSQKSHSRS